MESPVTDSETKAYKWSYYSVWFQCKKKTFVVKHGSSLAIITFLTHRKGYRYSLIDLSGYQDTVDLIESFLVLDAKTFPKLVDQLLGEKYVGKQFSHCTGPLPYEPQARYLNLQDVFLSVMDRTSLSFFCIPSPGRVSRAVFLWRLRCCSWPLKVFSHRRLLRWDNEAVKPDAFQVFTWCL